MALNGTPTILMLRSNSPLLLELNNYMSLILLYFLAYVEPLLIVLTIINNAIALWLLGTKPKKVELSQSIQLYYLVIAATDILNVFGSHLWQYLGNSIYEIY